MEKAKQYRKNDAALQPRRFDVLRFLRKKIFDGTAGGVLLCPFFAAADALAHDRALFEAVERGRVIFIGNDAIIRVLRCVNFLCFALVE